MVAVVACRPADGFPVVYLQFVDGVSTRGGFDVLLKDVRISRNACGPTVPLNGRTTYSAAGRDAGSVACHGGSDGDTYLTWSNESLAIVARASAPPAEYGELLEWWRTAGPPPGSAV
ncbi:hypothetical protein ABZ951_04870 [Streptomyces sp. NPDC046215]|uniref:hypothetical protein n=1 Tax=Streptomyces sp. NPDC046215 TaxID=3155774 RepID=UPI0033E89A95